MSRGRVSVGCTPVPDTEYGIGKQVPPTFGHSNTLVVPDDDDVSVGENFWVTLQVPGPGNELHVPNWKLNGTLIPLPDARSTEYPASTVMSTDCDAVVLIGTFPKPSDDGDADATDTPVPELVYGMPMQVPPTIGHSNTFVVADEPVSAGGRVALVDVQVPGPEKPPPVPHVSKSNANGAFKPDPDATSVR